MHVKVVSPEHRAAPSPLDRKDNQMRTSLFLASLAVVGTLATAAPAAAQAQRPAVTVEVKPGSSYSFSLEQIGVIGAGAVAGYVAGQMVFMGHLFPAVTGVAGGYLANLWYMRR